MGVYQMVGFKPDSLSVILILLLDFNGIKDSVLQHQMVCTLACEWLVHGLEFPPKTRF